MRNQGDRVWLTTGQASDIVGYCIPWVRKAIKDGRLKARTYSPRKLVPGDQTATRVQYRINRADLNAFMDREFNN